ncbi:MAG: hypothetical protein SH850_18650 [Planctomycetaceae bacterium]|nr:hypothetical protein [Planctomycetaceae bacterium]
MSDPLAFPQFDDPPSRRPQKLAPSQALTAAIVTSALALLMFVFCCGVPLYISPAPPSTDPQVDASLADLRELDDVAWTGSVLI